MFYVELVIQCTAIDNHGCMMLLLGMYFLPKSKSDLHLQVNRDGDANANENRTSYD